MPKFFNIAGPCDEKDHYMIPVENRNKEIQSLIAHKHYFVIHAARQTGKTTLIQHLVTEIETQNKYYALYCSLESVNAFSDPQQGIPEILANLKFAVKYSNISKKEKFAKNIDTSQMSSLIKDALADYCSQLDRPLIVFFDEIDGVQDGTLITFLRQLRDGFITRNKIPFLHSAVLVGMRNIREYKSRIREGFTTLGSASPFNIITEAVTLNNFSRQEIENLYLQHTEATGQVFEHQAIEKVYQATDGQPWLVNAIARECVTKLLNEDFAKSITASLIDQAIQNIIVRRDTHIDSLLDKLKDERVRKVIEPLITGEENKINILDDDTQFCLDLGLIKNENNTLQPANRIYAEVIIRMLNYNTQYHLHTQIQNHWIDETSKIDMAGLLGAFQQFWRENSDIWEEKYQYKEAAPHLILQAFLQRIINGGGNIIREYASNRNRMDLCVQYAGKQYPIELKLFYRKAVEQEGIKQLRNYMDSLGEKTGWLVIFDRNPAKTWDEKIYWKIEQHNDFLINIVGC